MGEFNEGDVVKLKSGGPKMTIKEINDNGEVYCQWFSGTEIKTDFFGPTSLVKEKETYE